MGGRSSGSGGILDRRNASTGMVSESSFMREAERQGIDGEALQNDLYDYVESSYGGIGLADRVSKFIENAPASMMYNSGTIYRGLWFETEQEFNTFLASHKEGQLLKTRRDGLSWTASQDVANNFAQSSNYNVILVNQDSNRIAMGIQNIADTPDSSHEVLYSNKVDFTVTRVSRTGNTVYMYVKQKRKK